MRARLIAGMLALLLSAPATADYLEVRRPAVAREHASSSSDEVARLTSGMLVELMNTRQRSGYYHVALADGAQAWVYRTLVRRYPGPLPTGDSDEPVDSPSQPPTATGGAINASAFATSDCPPEGTAQHESLQELNRQKNRSIGPSPAAVSAVAFEDLLFPESNSSPWSANRAIELVGYVHLIKPGSGETCNCGATRDSLTDTHIELVSSESATGASERVIAEITPTWRRYMRRVHGVDWSTSTLKRDFTGKWVKVSGWMMFDRMHANNAANAITPNNQIWRGTAWEIHPVTALEEVPPPVQ